MKFQPKSILQFVCFLLLLSFQKIQAQNFTIVHDLQTDITTYYKIGKGKDTVSVAEMAYKKPGRISVIVENFNPFYWDAKVTVIGKPADESSNQIGMFLSGLTQGLDVPGFPGLASRGGIQFNAKTLKRLQDTYYQLEEWGTQLEELKYNIKKTEVSIKSETKQTGDNILALIDMQSFNTGEVRKKGKLLDDTLYAQLPDSLLQKPSFEKLLSRIVKTFNEITNTPFRFLYSMQGNIDIGEIKLQVFPRRDSLNAKDTITKYFAMRDKADIKIRNTIGMAFTYFSDVNASYYVSPDQKIAKGKGDLFTPVLSSILHFYSNKNSGFKWGGAFGFGIPLTGERKDITFLLGPSAALGRNELIFISAGISTTKVPVLADGLKVGQTVPGSDYMIPLHYVFRAGAFVSISFNMRSVLPK